MCFVSVGLSVSASVAASWVSEEFCAGRSVGGIARCGANANGNISAAAGGCVRCRLLGAMRCLVVDVKR